MWGSLRLAPINFVTGPGLTYATVRKMPNEQNLVTFNRCTTNCILTILHAHRVDNYLKDCIAKGELVNYFT